MNLRKYKFLKKIILVIILFSMGFSVQKSFAVDLLKRKHIVFLINDNDSLNYMAHQTIPKFANLLQNQSHGEYRTTVILGTGENGSYRFSELEQIEDADLLVLFLRRVALPTSQVNSIKKYINSGKPVLGLRTANHAFSLLPNMSLTQGHVAWDNFVADVLGCENRGYGGVEWGTNVSVSNEDALQHPILLGVDKQWHSKGNVYKVAPLLDKNSYVFLFGEADGEVQPIAWSRRISGSLNKVFYTSLGHPEDFKDKNFSVLLRNAISWLTE